MIHFWANRTPCGVLEELRALLKASPLAHRAELYLIEELQVMYNKMEAALADKHDIEKNNEEWHNLNNKLKKLQKEYIIEYIAARSKDDGE